MSFRPTLAALSKASRMPMTAKMGNKEYYKGTGSFPGLGPKRVGRHSPRSKAPYILMPSRMRTFVVPKELDACKLKPYVSTEVKIANARQQSDWPEANTKPQDVVSRRNGLFGPNGFDGAYYLQLAEHFAERKKA